MTFNSMKTFDETHPTGDAIGPEVDKVLALVATAGAHIEDGRMVDLTALDARVEGLCSALRNLPAEDARRHIGTLEDLVVALDGLNAEINHRLRALTTQPAPAAAASAYAKAES